MEFGDRVTQQHPSDVSVGGVTSLLVMKGGAVHSDHPTCRPLRVTQIGQPFDDLAEPFGRTTSFPLKRSLAALTSSSSAFEILDPATGRVDLVRLEALDAGLSSDIDEGLTLPAIQSGCRHLEIAGHFFNPFAGKHAPTCNLANRC